MGQKSYIYYQTITSISLKAFFSLIPLARQSRFELGHSGQPRAAHKERRVRASHDYRCQCRACLETERQQRHRAVGSKPTQRGPASAAAPAEAVGPHAVDQHRRHLGRRRRRHRQLECLDRGAVRATAMGGRQR